MYVMNDKKRQFNADEPSAPWSSQDQKVEDLLAKAHCSEVPEHLAERVMAASAPMLSISPEDVELAELLDVAAQVATPAGLADRIMAASAPQLGKQPVIARIGFVGTVQRLALAACVVFAVLVAIRLDQGSSPRTVDLLAFQGNKILSVEEEGYLLEDLNLGEYAYLADTRELDFNEIATELNGLRRDLELWQYGLLAE